MNKPRKTQAQKAIEQLEANYGRNLDRDFSAHHGIPVTTRYIIHLGMKPDTTRDDGQNFTVEQVAWITTYSRAYAAAIQTLSN